MRAMTEWRRRLWRAGTGASQATTALHYVQDAMRERAAQWTEGGCGF